MFDWLKGLIGDVFGGLGASISSAIWDQMLQWIYMVFYNAIAQFFTMISGMGSQIFDLPWVDAVVRLFSYFGWALFIAGVVIAVFDAAIEAQSGRASVRDTALNCIKGFMAVSLFTVVPIRLYQFCITLQGVFANDLTRLFAGSQTMDVGKASMTALEGSFKTYVATLGMFNLLAMIALAYCVIKVFFSNIKRGGILLIMIAVGSMYMISVPRGYTDGFISWCKQVFGLCLTAFLQTTLLFLGLMTFSQNMLLGLGIMLAASEVPRIAQHFGLDTSVRANMSSAIYATQAAVNLTRTVARAGASAA